MLKAVIVYVPGSGGNLLARSLSLAEHTIPCVPESLAQQQPNLKLTAAEKLKFYNNWNSNNWTATEKEIGIWYHQGKQDFVKYEQSDLLLIDHFHPVDFTNENNKKILWDTVNTWKHIIMITWQPNSVDLIHQLACLKRKDLNHSAQLPKEIAAYNCMLAAHLGPTIAWENMQDEQSYINEIDRLAQALQLQLDLDLVRQLWQSWRHATDTLLNNE
jgi:hypothetical protein